MSRAEEILIPGLSPAGENVRVFCEKRGATDIGEHVKFFRIEAGRRFPIKPGMQAICQVRRSDLGCSFICPATAVVTRIHPEYDLSGAIEIKPGYAVTSEEIGIDNL